MDLFFCTSRILDDTGFIGVQAHRIIMEQIPYVKRQLSTKREVDMIHVPGLNVRALETVVRLVHKIYNLGILIYIQTC